MNVFEKRIDGIAVARVEFTIEDSEDVLAQVPRDRIVYTIDPPPSIEMTLERAGFRRWEDLLIMRGPVPEPGQMKTAARVETVSDCKRLVGIGEDTYPIHLRHDLSELEELVCLSGCQMYALFGASESVLGRVLIDMRFEIAKIRYFGIHRECRGQGGGRFLLASSLAIAGAVNGAQAVVLPNAAKFYGCLGWQVVKPAAHWAKGIGESTDES